MSLMLHSAAGFIALHVIAWALSENRTRVAWRTVLPGMALTIALAVVLLKVPVVADLFRILNDAVGALERATTAGSAFVFGYLGGGTLPFDEKFPGSSFVLAFRALPLVLVISALSALLFYWRVLPMIVRGFSFLLQRTMGIGGAAGVSAAANVFVGMVEAPLFVRPYIAGMSRSELFVLMTCGMATIAGTVMVLYASILASTVPDALSHILIASVVATPAAIVVAVLMVPPAARGVAADIKLAQEARSSMDAITRGTLDGAVLLINIVAMLIVLVALVHLANQGLGALPAIGGAALTLERMLGWLMAPVVWIMGIPWSEAAAAGGLMGVKTVLNELIAFIEMSKLPADALSARSKLMMTYALCGFANLGSLGIMIGGLASMAPDRRTEIVTLGAKTLVSGTLATLIAGAVVGMLM
jgi:concentrative nucleoside transporter, CNT family